MEAIFYKEWRNQNSESAFPFIYGDLNLPENLFVDASIAVYGSPSVWLKNISVKYDSIYGELVTHNSVKFIFFLDKQEILPYTVIDIKTASGKKVGKILTGSYFSDFNSKKRSISSSFDDGRVALNPICVFSYSSNQLSSITINNNKTLNGFVSIHEGPGLQINGNNNLMIIDAVGKGSETLLPENCCDPNQVILKTINGVPPPVGDINISIKQDDIGQPSNTLDKRQVIRIDQVSNGIKIQLAK